MDRNSAIQQMNYLGSKGKSFFFLVNYAMDECHIYSSEEANNKGIKFNFKDTYKNYSQENKVSATDFQPQYISLNSYRKAFEKVQQHLHRGNSYLVNLTAKTQILSKNSLEDIFFQSKAKYRLLFRDQFVVFSPETFVKIKNGKIFTYPMKGTIDAQKPNAHKLLINNKKEQAEHATIVDLLRNDLSLVAHNVTVEKFRYIDHIKTNNKELLQVSSKISGDLPDDYKNNLGTILFKMLPAGSVTGAPKKKTLEIIENTENYKRGFYTGIAGYFDGTELDSCVLIRFIEKIDGKLYYKSGGGITSQSIMEDEYNELKDKIYVPTH